MAVDDFNSKNDLAYSQADWIQLESPEEVEKILKELKLKPKFDIFKCAQLYDLAYPGYLGDKEYYLEKCKKGSVLYLGVGTGRIFIPLALKNPNILGLDNSHEMLSLLRKKTTKIEDLRLLEMDALSEELEGQMFDFVIAPYSFLQYFNNQDVKKLLSNTYRLLKPGGEFLTDFFSPFLIPFRKEGLEMSTRFPAQDTKVVNYVTYEHISQTMKELVVFSEKDEPDKVLEMDMNYYFPSQIIELLSKSGFVDLRVTGDFTARPLVSSKHEIVVFEAKKPLNN